MDKPNLLKNWLSDGLNSISEKDPVYKHLDSEIEKEFSMMDGYPWVSWQEFGTHKHVTSWVLLKTGYAIGFNENPSIGWSYPVKKLNSVQLEMYRNHNQDYYQYYNIER